MPLPQAMRATHVVVADNDAALAVDEVTTEVLLRFLAFCRTTSTPGRPGGNVYSIRDGRNVGYAPTTINRRLAAISGLFSYRQMRDGSAANYSRLSRSAEVF